MQRWKAADHVTVRIFRCEEEEEEEGFLHLLEPASGPSSLYYGCTRNG